MYKEIDPPLTSYARNIATDRPVPQSRTWLKHIVTYMSRWL